MDILNDKLLRPAEICKILRVSRRTLYDWKKSGKFPPTIEIGRICLWSDADLNKMASSKSCLIDILNDKFFKINEMCKILRVTRATLWNWRNLGKFPPTITIGTTYRWSEKDLNKMIKHQTKQARHTVKDEQADK